MQRILRLSALLCFFLSSLVSCKDASSVKDEQENIAAEENDKEDGIEQAIAQEFRMTKDPATNDVPVERLLPAMKFAEHKSNLQRTAASLTWTERGPNNIGGRTRALLVDKNDPTGNTVFAGSVGGGIWKCTNFKSSSYSWARTNDFMPNLAVTVLAQNPANFNIMYAGTGEGFGNADAIRGAGIFKSIDGGQTWSQLASTAISEFAYVEDIVVTSAGTIFAATKGSYCNYGGVSKSTDGGATWTRVIGSYNGSGSCTGAVNMRGVDLEIAANGDLYATTGMNSSSSNNFGRVWKSPVGIRQGDATTWTNITPTPPTGESGFRRIELAVAPSDAQTLYLLCQKYNASNVTKFYKSTNGGTSWTPVTVPSWCDQGTIRTDFTRDQAWYDLIATFDPLDATKLLIGGVDIMKSADGGSTFTQMTRWSGSTSCGTMPVVHSDQHNIVFMNGSSTDLIVSNDGGIFYSANGGTTFSNRNSGYNVTQYYSVAIHPAAGSNYMLAGAQDNGSHRFSTAGVNAVTSAWGGDGALCFIDQVDPANQVVSYVYSNYHISRNNGTSFSYSTSDNNGEFINPTDYDSRAKALYFGYTSGNIGRILNVATGTPSIEAVPVALMTTQYTSAVKVDPNTDNRVYVAAYSGIPTITKIDNANSAVPLTTTVNLPTLTSGSYISSIDVEDGNANHLLVTLSNYGVTSVYESSNGGITWDDIEGDLPDMPVRWGIFLPSTDKRIALATDLGVWTTGSAAGSAVSWTPDNLDLANVRVDMIKYRKSDSTIAIGTHGRGVFTTKLSLLPVTLMEFTGRLQAQNAILTWKTSSEANTMQFEIERSFDGNRFEKIGIVAAAGFSNNIREYGYTDKEPVVEISYYRLKTVDKDARSSYSKIIAIRNTAPVKQSMEVLTNPFNTYIDLSLSKVPKGAFKLQLTDLTGKVVDSRNYPSGSQTRLRYNLSHSMSKGVYVLTLDADGERFSKKVYKQ